MIILDEYFWILDLLENGNIVLAVKKKKKKREVAGCLHHMVIFIFHAFLYDRLFCIAMFFFIIHSSFFFVELQINLNAAFIYWFSFYFYLS